jgi:hypothetical protein
MDKQKVIEKLRSKDDEKILNQILDEVENKEDVKTERPDPEALGLDTTTYQIPRSQGLRLMWDTSKGTYPLPIIRIANILNTGQSPIIGIFGKEQTGKSNTALYLNHVIHNELNLVKDEFNPINQTVYEVVPFLVLLRHTTRRSIMFDEAGETLNKNDYNSKMNRAVAGSLRTQSKRQIPYFFVTPEAGELDPRIREKIDIEIEMVAKGKAEVTLYEKIHGRKGENKQQRYEFASLNEKWNVPKAPADIREKYDKLDSHFKGRYLDELLHDAVEEKLENQNDMMEFG